MIEKIANNIYLIKYNNKLLQPNIGVLISDNGTVLIDAGNSKMHHDIIINDLKEINAPKIKYIIYTHHHWDHSFASCYYKDVKFIAGDKTAANLREYKKINWSKEYLENDMVLNPIYSRSHRIKLKVFQNWDDFSIIDPDIVFINDMCLKLGEIKLRIYISNSVHSDDCYFIEDINNKVIFTGDGIYHPPFSKINIKEKFDKNIVNELLKTNNKLFIHSHGEILDIDNLSFYLKYEN